MRDLNRNLATVTCALLLLAFGSGSGSALTLIVDTTIDAVDSNPGDQICSPCSLRAAVQEANLRPGQDSIWLPAGTFELTLLGEGEDNAATGDLDILDDVDIVGAGAGLTVIDANGIDRVLHLVAAPALTQVLVHGLTITGGSAVTLVTPAGGGILVDENARLYLNHCTLTGNTANAGGAIGLGTSGTPGHGGWAEIWYSDISGNASVDAGFTSEYGAAIGGEFNGTLWLHSSTVSGNTASSNQRTTISVDNGSGASITNTTVSSNVGAGFEAFNTSTMLVNCTIVDNGMNGVMFGSYSGADGLLLRNTIIAGHNVDCYRTGGNYSHANNLDSDGTCELDAGSGELPATDPMLGPLAANGGPTMTHDPLPGSPVVDAGDAGTCNGLGGAPADQRGVPRPQDGDRDGVALCDIGAVEAADLIFVDTFDSFTTDAWSEVNP